MLEVAIEKIFNPTVAPTLLPLMRVVEWEHGRRRCRFWRIWKKWWSLQMLLGRDQFQWVNLSLVINSLSHYRFFSKSVFIHSFSVAIQWYLAIHFSPDHSQCNLESKCLLISYRISYQCDFFSCHFGFALRWWLTTLSWRLARRAGTILRHGKSSPSSTAGCGAAVQAKVGAWRCVCHPIHPPFHRHRDDIRIRKVDVWCVAGMASWYEMWRKFFEAKDGVWFGHVLVARHSHSLGLGSRYGV